MSRFVSTKTFRFQEFISPFQGMKVKGDARTHKSHSSVMNAKQTVLSNSAPPGSSRAPLTTHYHHHLRNTKL